jgi:amino acid adenylation domain-containing protein
LYLSTLDNGEYSSIPKTTEELSYILSSSQKRLWVLSQIEEGSVAYNLPSYHELDGKYDVGSFKKAILATIDRHEILRTIFKEDENGEVRQWILTPEELGFEIDYQDYRKEEDKEACVKIYIEEDGNKVFDLEKGPLLRASLLQIAEDRYVFYYNMHHIIGDGWSTEVLGKDVNAYYESYKENKVLDLPELRIQYKDYSAWQISQLEEASYQLHKSYWLDKFSGELPVLELPTSKQRPLLKTNNGKTLGTYISKEDSLRFKEYSQAKGGTLFMGLVASLNTLFYRYTGQEDFIIGSPIAGREHIDLEDQIGFYVNTLALRNQVKGEESFDALFGKVKQNTLDAYTHQMYPFDRLVEDLDLKRDTSRSAVFDVMVTLQNNGEKVEGVAKTEEELTTIVDYGEGTSKFDLDLTFEEVGDYISFSVEYNTDVYDKEIIEQFIVHYKSILKGMLNNSDQPISEIEYLSKEEEHQLLHTFNDTKVDYPKGKTIIDLFEEQVASTLENVALVFEEVELTYKDLNERSNQFADYLRRSYDIQPDDLVGIKLGRSEQMIIAILGVLKSGGAYVPIDPEYPQERIGYMVTDSGCKVLIDEDELKNFSEQETIYTKENLPKVTTPTDLAYVIYTSGSTGQPKGVMVENRSLLDYALTFKETFELKGEDRVIQQASLSFDTHVEEIYPTLVSGSTLLFGKNGGRDIKELEELIQEKKASILSATPLILNELNTQKSDLSNLRLLISGGDKFSTTFVSNFLGKVPIYDTYGPSESTVCCTYSEIEKEENIAVIGKPINNRTIYILDAQGNIQPIGVIGEICIGGDGLARGYLNRPDLTAEKFVSNPFLEGARMYKTGDFGRWMSDGNIEFIGRNDDQVKIRGYRIELGEIESILQQNSLINEAVVLVKEDVNGDKNIVAYITSKEELNSSELRKGLSKQLPDYMIPAHFVQLEELPLTPNGKVDKKALPSPEGLGMSTGVEYVAPRNEVEEKLVGIWEEILGRENIGIDDDFFELGGNSIKAVSVSRADSFHIPLKTLYQKRTVRKCLEIVKGSQKDKHLVELYKNSIIHSVNILLIPYAGATDIAYLKLATELSSYYNVYTVTMPWHSLEDSPRYKNHQWVEEELLKEIKNKIKGKTMILGHCAGTSIALSLSHQLEKIKFPVIGLFQCADNYEKNYNFDLKNGGWSNYSDHEIWNEVILKLGFQQNSLHEKTKEMIINNLRHDSSVAEHIIMDIQANRKEFKLNIPIHSIYGEKDPLTVNYKRKYKNWRLFSDNVTYSSIKNAGHYFVNQNIPETVNEINKKLKEWS